MIDTTNAKWEYSKIEGYFIEYLNSHGYDGKLVKQYQSKTVFEISKDGFNFGRCDVQNIPMTENQCEMYMEQFEKSFELARKLQQAEQNAENCKTAT